MKRLLLLAALCACARQPNWNQDPVWERVPLSVDHHEIPEAFDSSVHTAIKAWNYAAGCTVVVDAEGSSPDVTIAWYDGFACGREAHIEDTAHSMAGTWRCTSAYAEVKVRTLTDVRSAYVTIAHELGHVLGLAHDNSALMSPTPELYDPSKFGANLGLLPLPSDAARNGLRKRYCQKE